MGKEAGKEREERSVIALLETDSTDFVQLPFPLLMVEPVLFHGSFPQVDLFDNHTVQVCCLRILHLLLVVENQRVISLRPEEMVGLPLAARQL